MSFRKRTWSSGGGRPSLWRGPISALGRGTIAHYQFLAFLRDKKRDRHVFDVELLDQLAERFQGAVDFDARRASLRTCLAASPTVSGF